MHVSFRNRQCFLWRYEPVRRTGKSDDWLTIFFARIIRFTVQKFQLFWVIFCIIIFSLNYGTYYFVISQNAKWGHAGFYIDCHRMTVRENILLQKSTGNEQGSFRVRKRTGTVRIWRARESEPIWGSGGGAPSGVQGQSPSGSGGHAGEAPLKLKAF